jgi:hypothetical protein
MSDLKIEISADLGNTLSATEQLKSKLNQTKETVELLKSELKGLNQSLTANDKAMAVVNKQLKGLNTNTKDGAKEAAGLKAQLSTLAGVNNTLAKGIVTTKLELANETNALKAHTKEVIAAEKGGSAMAKGLGKVWGGMRLLANIIPGLGIGGLVAIISGPLVDALTELFKKSNQAGTSLQEAFAESEGSVGGNIARLKALVSIARDVSKTDAARKEALGALNKEYDSFNGKLTLANINTKTATDLIDKQTAALIRQAKIKGVEDLITEETKKAAKVRIGALKDQLGAIDQFKNAIVTAFNPNLGQADAVVRGLKARDKALKESSSNVAIYSKELQKLLGEEADDGTLFKEPKPAKIKEKILKAFQKIRFKEEDFGFFDEQSIAFKLPVFVDLQIVKGLREIKPEQLLNGILGPQQIDEIKMQSALLGLGITKGVQDGIKVGVTALRFPELTDLYNSAIERTKNLAAGISAILSTLVVDSFVQLGDSIGKALAGAQDPLGSFFGGIAALIANSLKELGKYVITASTLIASLKKALNAAFVGNPALGVAAGIALIALGSALESALPNFGGGYAMVGERGPEVVRLPKGSDVIPNGQLGGIGAGVGVQVYIPSVTIKGPDLVLAFNRSTQQIRRNG